MLGQLYENQDTEHLSRYFFFWSFNKKRKRYKVKASVIAKYFFWNIVVRLEEFEGKIKFRLIILFGRDTVTYTNQGFSLFFFVGNDNKSS